MKGGVVYNPQIINLYTTLETISGAHEPAELVLYLAYMMIDDLWIIDNSDSYKPSSPALPLPFSGKVVSGLVLYCFVFLCFAF